MKKGMRFKDNLPKDSELNKLLAICEIDHELHLHELNDGALSMICLNCPFHHVLDTPEETVVREQMEDQGISHG